LNRQRRRRHIRKKRLFKSANMNPVASTSRAGPHILLLGTQMAVAGAQRVLLNQADWLAGRGYTVTAAFLYDRDGLEQRLQAEKSYPVLNFGFRKIGASASQNAVSFARGLFALLRFLRSERFDVIETFTHHVNLIGCGLAWLSGVRVRIGSHHGRIDRLPAWMNRLHTWMVNRGIIQKLVVVSAEVNRQAREDGIRPERLALIPNGVEEYPADLQHAKSIRGEILPDGKGNLILSVGALTYQKAHTYLLNAMPAVLERFPDALLALAGDGPLREELMTEAERLGLSERARFLGLRSDVADLMAAADVFVLPSRSEGMPLVLLEAMRAGLAIIATDVPGVRDALEQGKCGLIVPPEDAQAITRALTQLLTDESLRARLGRAARERFAREHTLDKMMSKYLALLDAKALNMS
jgi:glycosyltransferase involved in cell wall biosynthesis